MSPKASAPSTGAKPADYTPVTERPGLRSTPEALSMLVTRYAVAARHAQGKEVLEVACGAGMGLGWLGKVAKRLVGGDFTRPLLRQAQAYYKGRVPLVQLDAHALPFRDASFDLVILYEAIYYLARPDAFLKETRRVLRPGGMLLVCSANRERPGFVPSPLSVRYYSARELVDLLQAHGFAVQVFGAFPAAEGKREGLINLARKAASTVNLIPGSLKAREILKRIVYGKLVPFPNEVSDKDAPVADLVPLAPVGPTPHYKVLYALARLS
ncbi:MAG: class I SAM-dependent methyltransferase [Dehalococcoidia bacterium]|nr:class I SAM-dependent methyltransferase [Dehalococcoidia bacterium]MDW8119909.1 class I SAM-dependent methyltransferase [Chloroflexota bacterium]